MPNRGSAWHLQAEKFWLKCGPEPGALTAAAGTEVVCQCPTLEAKWAWRLEEAAGQEVSPECSHLQGSGCVLSHSVVSCSFPSHGLQPARLLCPCSFPSKNTGVGSHFLDTEIEPTSLVPPALAEDSLLLCHLG